MKWALGFATKGGMTILSSSGERVKIASVPVGNMHQPDPDEFAVKFLSRIGEGDTVLSPSGPNYTYLPGAYARGAEVHWIHPGKLKDVRRVPEHVLERFEGAPSDFYGYQPQNERVAALGVLTRAWINLERQRTGDENAYAQLLRRERDFFRFHKPDREGWIGRQVESEQRKFVRRHRAMGVVLSTEQQRQLASSIRSSLERLYADYFENPGATKEEKKTARRAYEELARERLEWFGIEEIEAFYAAEVGRVLVGTAENALFDNLIGPGAVKTRAQVLTYLRNPLFYPTAGHLRAYAGLGLKNGQAHRRRQGESDHGNREFKRALCFDFAEKYWQNDPIGFFRALYYAYKAHQYYTYWDLMVLTRDAFKALGMSEAEEDEDEAGTGGAEGVGSNGEVKIEAVRGIVARLGGLSHLDLIAKSAPVKAAIAELERSPDPGGLRLLFSKSPKDGLNLQVTPKRVERQVKRLLGVTLLDAIYYRWLASLGAPLPLAGDFIYLGQWREVEDRTDGVPETHDHRVVLRYFEGRVARLRQSRTLPVDIEQKLVPPSERTATAAE